MHYLLPALKCKQLSTSQLERQSGYATALTTRICRHKQLTTSPHLMLGLVPLIHVLVVLLVLCEHTVCFSLASCT